jgi:hypothetical protein
LIVEGKKLLANVTLGGGGGGGGSAAPAAGAAAEAPKEAKKEEKVEVSAMASCVLGASLRPTC